MKIHLFFCSIIFIFLLGFEGVATAANTYTWTGGNSTWNTATNWLLNGNTQTSSGSYPGQSGSTDIVNFNTSNFTATVPSSLTLTVATLNTTLNTNGSAGVSGVTVSVSSGSTLTINSGVSMAQPSSAAVCLTFAGAGKTNIAGTITAPQAASLSISSGANVYFNAITLNTTNSVVLTNNGTLNILSGSILNLGFAASIVNNGTLNSKGATFNLTSGTTYVFNNSGTVRDHGSTFSVTGQTVSMINSGSSASFYGSGTTITDASNGSNTFTITNSSSAVFTLDSAAVLTLNQQTDAFKNSATFSASLINAGCTINLGGQGASFANTGTVNMGPGSVINPSGTNVIVSNSSSGTFTLMSSAAGSAAIGVLSSSASCSGIFNVQRYITGTSSSYSGYRVLSSPVNSTSATSATSSSAPNYISLYYLNKNATANGITYNGIYTGGPGGTAGGFNATTTNPILYFYNETIRTSNATFTSGKNVGVSSFTSATGSTPVTTTEKMVSSAKTVNAVAYTAPSNLSIPVGNGFIDYFVGPNTLSSPSGTIAPATITNIGYINQQNVQVYLWYTPGNGTATGTIGQLSFTTPSPAFGPADKYQGFNMVGNPYPSTLSLKQMFADNTGIDNVYLLSDNKSTSGGYNVYTATGNSSPSPAYVVSGQGFLVHAKSGGQTLIFKEGEKAPTQQLTGASLLMGVPKQADQPLTGLYMKMVQDSLTYNYCGIYFRSDWASTFKTGDAIDLDGAQVSMSSYTSDGVRTSVNHQPDYTAGINVKLYASAPADGIYHLNIEGIRNIDTLYDIFLIDHYKKDSLDMRRYGSYAFNIYKSDTSSFGSSRFELSIHPRPLPAYKLLNFVAQKASAGVQLTWKTENEANYTGFVLQKADGTQYNQLNSQQSDGSGSYTFIDHNPITGSNTYRLQQSGITGSITYSSPVTIEYSRSGTDGAISVYPNPVKDVVNLIINQNSSSANSTGGTITINSSTSSGGSVSYGIKIMNIAGAVVMSSTCTDSEWHQSAVSLVPGTYIIQVVNNKDNSIVGKSLFIKI